MTDNKNTVERHGCIVCGKVYNLLVVTAPDGKIIDCSVTSPGGKIVPDPKPLVACERHNKEEIKAALASHYPGGRVEDQDED